MSDTKKCTKCGAELPLEQFNERRYKNGKVGYRLECKGCQASYYKQYRKDHKDEIAAQKKCYAQNHKPEIVAQKKQYYQDNKAELDARNKQYYQNHKVEVVLYKKRYGQEHNAERNVRRRGRFSDDIDYKLKTTLGSEVRRSIRGSRQCKHSLDLIGCSVGELRNYIEGQFQPGMTWDNWNYRGWHIDHIIPLGYFDFTDYEQQKRAWHYTNLRPLWAEENLGKKDKIIEIQLALL